MPWSSTAKPQYVEIPEKITYCVTLGDVLGAVAFLSMLSAPAFVEENPVLSLILIVICGALGYLSIKENGQIK